jgi:HAD superfamily hydrolase (TIGR01509 family)
MTVELLIFDCDGVLIDSEPVASRVLWKALQGAGVTMTHAEVHSRFTGYSEEDAKRICMEELGVEDATDVFENARASLYAEFARSLAPMPGMETFIPSLSCRKCVASNSTMERLRNSLGLFDLWREFHPNIFSAEMVARPKPAPDLFQFCARNLGIAPRACVVIDDSVHGVAGAVAAGMKAIGFVDPNDPRPGRCDVLAGAGAVAVATGVEELARALDTLFAATTPHPAERDSVAMPTPA